MAVRQADDPAARPLVGALAVVVKEGQVLLAQRGRPPDPNLWGFPGGHVEHGETGLEAAARELREETGIVARPREYLTNVDVLRHDDTGKVCVHYLLVAVLCTYESGQARADDDIVAAQWVRLSDIGVNGMELHSGVQDIAELARRRLRARIRKVSADKR